MIWSNPGPEIVGTKVDKPEDIKVKNEGEVVVIEMPLCYRDPVSREIKCTGKYIAKYRKGVVGPVELTVKYE